MEARSGLGELRYGRSRVTEGILPYVHASLQVVVFLKDVGGGRRRAKLCDEGGLEDKEKSPGDKETIAVAAQVWLYVHPKLGGRWTPQYAKNDEDAAEGSGY